jgi:DNA-binding cell septation regulator SpoVG
MEIKVLRIRQLAKGLYCVNIQLDESVRLFDLKFTKNEKGHFLSYPRGKFGPPYLLDAHLKDQLKKIIFNCVEKLEKEVIEDEVQSQKLGHF